MEMRRIGGLKTGMLFLLAVLGLAFHLGCANMNDIIGDKYPPSQDAGNDADSGGDAGDADADGDADTDGDADAGADASADAGSDADAQAD